jgi:hypothetical protein
MCQLLGIPAESHRACSMKYASEIETLLQAYDGTRPVRTQ